MTNVTVRLPAGAVPPALPDGVAPSVTVTGMVVNVYGEGGGGGPALEAHINAAEPHPAYDDMHSLRLIFENALL